MSLAFPSPGHQPTRPDGGETHVSARVLLVTKLIKAKTARAGATVNGMRDKRHRKGDLLIEVFMNFVSVFVCLFPFIILLRDLPAQVLENRNRPFPRQRSFDH